MTRLRIMGTAVLLRGFFECSSLLGTTYAIHHIHYTHKKLNMHTLELQIDNIRSWMLHSVQLYRNRQGCVYRD